MEVHIFSFSASAEVPRPRSPRGPILIYAGIKLRVLGKLSRFAGSLFKNLNAGKENINLDNEGKKFYDSERKFYERAICRRKIREAAPRPPLHLRPAAAGGGAETGAPSLGPFPDDGKQKIFRSSTRQKGKFIKFKRV